MDLVGIEPTNSSMPFPSTKYNAATANESLRQRDAVFMRLLCLQLTFDYA